MICTRFAVSIAHSGCQRCPSLLQACPSLKWCAHFASLVILGTVCGEMGCVNPSEHTCRSLAAHIGLCLYNFSTDLSLPQLVHLLNHVKARGKQIAREPAVYMVTLPPTPARLVEVNRPLALSLYSAQPPVTCPLPIAWVQLLEARIPLRCRLSSSPLEFGHAIACECIAVSIAACLLWRYLFTPLQSSPVISAAVSIARDSVCVQVPLHAYSLGMLITAGLFGHGQPRESEGHRWIGSAPQTPIQLLMQPPRPFNFSSQPPPLAVMDAPAASVVALPAPATAASSDSPPTDPEKAEDNAGEAPNPEGKNVSVPFADACNS